jgi:hypothetical protein
MKKIMMAVVILFVAVMVASPGWGLITPPVPTRIQLQARISPAPSTTPDIKLSLDGMSFYSALVSNYNSGTGFMDISYDLPPLTVIKGFKGQALWLKVGATGVPMGPQALTSAPYAFRSAVADRVYGDKVDVTTGEDIWPIEGKSTSTNIMSAGVIGINGGLGVGVMGASAYSSGIFGIAQGAAIQNPFMAKYYTSPLVPAETINAPFAATSGFGNGWAGVSGVSIKNFGVAGRTWAGAPAAGVGGLSTSESGIGVFGIGHIGVLGMDKDHADVYGFLGDAGGGTYTNPGVNNTIGTGVPATGLESNVTIPGIIQPIPFTQGKKLLVGAYGQAGANARGALGVMVKAPLADMVLAEYGVTAFGKTAGGVFESDFGPAVIASSEYGPGIAATSAKIGGNGAPQIKTKLIKTKISYANETYWSTVVVDPELKDAMILGVQSFVQQYNQVQEYRYFDTGFNQGYRYYNEADNGVIYIRGQVYQEIEVLSYGTDEQRAIWNNWFKNQDIFIYVTYQKIDVPMIAFTPMETTTKISGMIAAELAAGGTGKTSGDTMAKGAVFPASAADGDLFYLTTTSGTNTPGVYVYRVGMSWHKVATDVELGNYATTASLANYATTGTLANYATTASLASYATKASLGTLATKSSLVAADIPALDATKITTGSFANTRITGLGALATKSSLVAADIPALDATKITTGSFANTRITGLGALATKSSLVAADIPALDATKITTGTIASARLTGTYAIGISGNAATATTADNSLALGGVLATNYATVTYVNTRTTIFNSDLRLKSDITPVSGALGKVAALQGVSYKWKDAAAKGLPTVTQLGLIAQDVEKVAPELVSDAADGYKQLNYNGMSALFVESIKELKAENEALRARVKALEDKTK